MHSACYPRAAQERGKGREIARRVETRTSSVIAGTHKLPPARAVRPADAGWLCAARPARTRIPRTSAGYWPVRAQMSVCRQLCGPLLLIGLALRAFVRRLSTGCKRLSGPICGQKTGSGRAFADASRR